MIPLRILFQPFTYLGLVPAFSAVPISMLDLINKFHSFSLSLPVPREPTDLENNTRSEVEMCMWKDSWEFYGTVIKAEWPRTRPLLTLTSISLFTCPMNKNQNKRSSFKICKPTARMWWQESGLGEYAANWNLKYFSVNTFVPVSFRAELHFTVIIVCEGKWGR